MARVNRNIFDGFPGTAGTVVGGNQKGIGYLRSKSKNTAQGWRLYNWLSEPCLQWGIAFISALRSLFIMSYNGYAKEMTGANNALSHMLKNVIEEDRKGMIYISNRADPNQQAASALKVFLKSFFATIASLYLTGYTWRMGIILLIRPKEILIYKEKPR